MKGTQQTPLGLRSSTLPAAVQAWQLPQAFVYAVIVGAVAAWSWERWQSGHSTAIAVLTASACMIALEIALSAASPWAARALLGRRDGGVRNVHSFAPPPGGAEPAEDLGLEGSAALVDEIELKLSNVHTRLQHTAARLRITQERIDEYEQERARMLGEPDLAPYALSDLDQLIAASRKELGAVELDDARQVFAEAVKRARDPFYADLLTGGAPADAQPHVGSTRARAKVADIVFAIGGVTAAVMFVLFLVLLWSA